MTSNWRSLLRVILIVLVFWSLANHRTLADPIRKERTAQVERIQPQAQGKHYSGEIYLDLNMNGIREFDETGIEGVRVTLETLDGELMQETQTGSDGEYLFANITQEGTFRVRVWPEPGYQVTTYGDFTISTLSPQGLESRATGLFQGIFLPLISA